VGNLEIINNMISACKPMKYENFNVLLIGKEDGSLKKLETEENMVGIRPIDFNDESKGYCTSTLALIATLTDVLIGKRLSFVVDDNGYITGVEWYTPK
jgi:hypothetical protein